jgi:AraC-like DNA-binding protein
VAPGAEVKGLGSLSVIAAKPAVAELERRGLDPAPAFQEAHLTPAALSSFDYRLPHASVRALWEAAARLAGDGWFGLHTGRDLPAGDYDLFDYLLSTSSTVGEGLARMVSYARLVYDHTNLRLIVEPGDARIVRRVPVTAPQYDEFTVALLVFRCRANSGVDWKPRRIGFQHPREHDDGTAARTFGCPVTFGTPQTEIRFAPSVLDLPQTRADSKLLDILIRYADAWLATLPSPDSLVGRVRAAITRQATREFPTLASTAASLGIPERTLQRRLAAEGVSHSTLLDEARRQLALRYLGNAALSVTDIGYLLHFSDPASFHRAFRRWTGESPLEYRRRFYSS